MLTLMSDISASIEFGSSEAEIEALESALAEFGIKATVRANRMHFSEVALPWDVILEVYVAAKFLDSLASAAGADAWQALRNLTRRIAVARRLSGRRDGTVKVEDAGGTRVHIAVNLPDEAFQRLTEMTFESGHWYEWDPRTSEWRNIDPKA